MSAGPEASPRLIFSKSFPGSLPPWEEIIVDKNGAGQYKDDPKDEDPLKFQLTSAELSDIFGLADKLNHFTRQLESGLKVANMGMKTFRYEADGQAKPNEVKFNYTEDLDAKALADWFERIAASERLRWRTASGRFRNETRASHSFDWRFCLPDGGAGSAARSGTPAAVRIVACSQ